MRSLTTALLLSIAPVTAFIACSSSSNDGSTGGPAGSATVRPGVLTAQALAQPAPAASTADGGVPDAGSLTFQCTGLGAPVITFGPTVPPDLRSFTNQGYADCFAWWEFVSLNWPTEGSMFGAPGDTTPVAWETYMAFQDLYPPDGSRPPPWGTPQPLPKDLPALPKGKNPRVMRSFSAISKVAPTGKRRLKALARIAAPAADAGADGGANPFTT
ncbi:MAG: hypothetical protein R3F14_42130, partial [Polyangiaceae bacterium]